MNSIKLVSILSLAGAVCLPVAAHAELAFNLGAVSLYKSRGVDQDGRDKALRPAIQGGVDYSFDNGLYVGNWNSSGRFGKADVEIDVYGGYAGEIANGLGYDIGYIHYYYPNENTWNSGEVYVGLSYGVFSVKAYRGITSDVNRNDMYYTFTYTQPFAEKWALIAGLNYTDFGDSDIRGKTDYSLGLSYAVNSTISISATLAGANRKNDVMDGSRDNRFILGLSAAF